MVTLSKANSRSSTQFSSARLQIWHEVEGNRRRNGGAPSDVASFVTAGTALSGPLRERLVASASRLMLYLGRSGEFITVFSKRFFHSLLPRPPLISNPFFFIMLPWTSWLTSGVSVTDDLEIKTEGPTLVKLKPRKGPTPFSRKASRWQWVKGESANGHSFRLRRRAVADRGPVWQL